MSTLISTFDITKEALPDLLLKIQQGKVQLPDLQRSFCWSDDLIIQLIASVSLGCPVGAIMLLEQGNSEWNFQPRLVEGVSLDHVPVPTHLILDGQQRATALFMALFSGNPVLIKDRRSHKNSERWYYIDIEAALNPEIDREDTVLSLNKSRTKPHFGTKIKAVDCTSSDREFESGLFPIAQIFRYAVWRQNYCKYWNYQPAKLELIDRFEQEVVKRFEHYQVPVIQLKAELPKPAVCRVFEKTNTQGTELNFFDLATACFASEDFSLRSDWTLKEKRLKQHRVLQSLREMDFLSCVTLVATYHRRRQVIESGLSLPKLPGVACGRAEVLSLSVEEYKAFAEQVIGGYEEAARFLYGQRIVTSEDLPYPIQLVALAAILTVVGYPQEQMRSKLEQWFWSGCCCALYTSWHESRAARDMLEVPAWLLNEGALPTTIREATFNTTRLLSVRRRQGAIYKGVSALLRKGGAIDFATGETLSDVNVFNDPIESHHVFPVAYCKRQSIEMSRYNCLVNRTPLSQLSNQKIGGKAPSHYLQGLLDQGISRQRLDAILRSHLIEPETLWTNDFEAFFASRTQALLELVNRVMGKRKSSEVVELGIHLANFRQEERLHGSSTLCPQVS
jgi:hypothetical protein